jgi:hypothetical protein
VVLRCTGKLLSLLGRSAGSLADAPPSEDDSYANLLWLDRRKYLLTVHAGTLFPIFVADIHVSDLRPIERRIIDLIERALREEHLSVDALGRLAPEEIRLAKTVSKQVLGVMNQMAFEIGWHIDPNRRPLERRHARPQSPPAARSLHTKDGDYRLPLELVHERLKHA